MKIENDSPIYNLTFPTNKYVFDFRSKSEIVYGDEPPIIRNEFFPNIRTEKEKWNQNFFLPTS